MKNALNKILLILILIATTLPQVVFASDADFSINTHTEITYETGNRYVTVKNTYTRKVHNSKYYYPASGEKVFHLPDLPDSTEEDIKNERVYKKDSLTVINTSGSSVNYSVEELDSGQGMYVKVPNYKQTTSSSQYEIVLSYKTHDYVRKVGNWVNIQAPALPKDVVFEQTEKETGTTTKYSYGLDIVTDKNISELAKIFPSKYTKEERSNNIYYSFDQTERIGNSPYLEFGTEQVFKFELNYTTPKTDNFIPEEYSKIFKALSTNIYEISLPREFSETNQKVMFSNISPTPKSITKDSEGNMIATFEVPANEESNIVVEGYIWIEQSNLDDTQALPNIKYSDYLEEIKNSSYLNKYTIESKYWEVNDTYIQQEAEKLSNYQDTLLGLIESDYKYVNEKLEYDTTKATSENERIGAKAALEGGASVCMEYADAMIAILRAQGIPARAALGYSNIEEEAFAKDEQVRHQWVQIWIPDYGWLSIDPTFESNNMKIGSEIDKVLWETFNGDSLSNIKVFSADRLDSLDSDGYKVKIYAVDKASVPPLEELSSYIDIIPNSSYESIDDLPEAETYNVSSWFNTFLKTTTIGKSLVITGPIIISLILITILIILITSLIKRVKSKKKKS